MNSKPIAAQMISGLDDDQKIKLFKFWRTGYGNALSAETCMLETMLNIASVVK